MKDKMIEAATKHLIAEGKLIAAGFESFRIMVIPPNAPKAQVEEMRMAFFGGAQHLFASIMNTLDAGEEPSDADMKRLDDIHAELDGFIADFAMHNMPAEGRA